MNHSAGGSIQRIPGQSAAGNDASPPASDRVLILEQSLDHLPVGVTVYDEDFKLLAWNKTAAEIIQTPPGMLREGAHIRELIDHVAAAGFYGEGESEHLADVRLQQMADGELSREHNLADGRVLEVQGSRPPEGGYVYVVQDITAQRQAQSATKELATIVSSSEASILSLSPDGIINSWNTGAEHLYGYTAEEAIGQPFHLLSGGAAQIEAQDSIWQRVLQGEQIRQETTERTHKDGHSFFISLSMSPILGDGGEVIGVSGIAYDITERLQAEQAIAKQRDELESLNGQKNRLFSIIAHDLRTPFNSLLGFSEILSENAADLSPNDVREYARMMHQSASQANALLENLLDWSRLQMGGLKSEPRPFDVAMAIEKALALNTPNAVGKNISIEQSKSSLMTAMADPQMVETVLRNLIGNAIKFTARDGTVSLDTKRREGEIIISISDTGIGISAERLERLFEFETGTSTAGTDGEKGTGLGLQLCRDLIELQGGALTVESTVGRGSTFLFTLPSAI